MLRQRITIALVAGVVLVVLLSVPPVNARAAEPAALRDVEPRRSPVTAAYTVTTLDLDLAEAIVRSRGGVRLVGFPLAEGRGWVLSKVGPPRTGSAENGVGKSSVGAADEAPEGREAEQERPQSGPPGEGGTVPELEPEHAEDYQPECAPIALISADDVNVRAKPDLKSAVLETLPRRTKVYLISVAGPWYYVSVPGRQLKGYVFGSFIYQLKDVVVTADQVNLRKEPSLKSEVAVVLARGERFVLLGEANGYYRVISPTKGFAGWVSKEYSQLAKPELPRYKVVGDGVNFRRTPNVDAEIITQLDAGTEVRALGRDEKWSLVERGGTRGWVYSEYLVPAESFHTAAGRDIGRRLAARGLDLRGVRYSWGGESLSGFDCSGFVYFLLREQFGLRNLPRRASEQYYAMGTPVDKEDLQVGDLVFFTTYKAGPSHVGIYLGDGNFVHASSAGGKVQINSMSEGYYKRRFVGARRITQKDLTKYGDD